MGLPKNRRREKILNAGTFLCRLLALTFLLTPNPILAKTEVDSAFDDTRNILLIIGDDLGVDNISAYKEHSQSATTPTVDQLANQGVLFRNAWANPMCSPTRASILTGRHAFRHGVTKPGGRSGRLSSDEITIAELLSSAGYQTALFGKWHLGSDKSELPTNQGFDYYVGAVNASVEDYFDWTKTVITSQGGSPTTTKESRYATQVVAEEAIDWINKTTRPWLSVVAFNAPHSPFHVPPSDRYSRETLEGKVGENCRRSDTAVCYRAMVEAMDSYISDILTQIAAEKLANTLIIFLGDNGTPGAATIAEGPFARGHAKKTVYEGGVNVPLIIAGGNRISIENSEVSELIQIQDVFSTIAAVANVTEPTNVKVDGQNLLGYVFSAEPTPPARKTLFSELTGPLQWAASNGVTKYIYNDGNEECYNLLTDAGETKANSGDQDVCDQLRDNKPN